MGGDVHLLKEVRMTGVAWWHCGQNPPERIIPSGCHQPTSAGEPLLPCHAKAPRSLYSVPRQPRQACYPWQSVYLKSKIRAMSKDVVLVIYFF